MNKEFPEYWKSIDLKDICYFQEGPGLRNWQYRKKGTKFINIRCIKDGYLDTSIAQFLSTEEVSNKYKHFLLNEGDYVLSSSGTIGRIAVVRKYDLPLLLNTSVIRFKTLDQLQLNEKYLFYFLQSQQFFEKINEQSQGSAQFNFGPSHLKTINAHFPPQKDQKNIAEILSSIDILIEKLGIQIDKIKLLKISLEKSLLDFGLKIENNTCSSKKNFVISSYSNIDICKYKKIGEFAYSVTRKNLDKSSSADVYSVTKYKGFVRSLDYFKRQVFSKDLSNYKVVKKGEFAYSTIHIDEGAIGLLREKEALISPMYTVFKVDKSVDNLYIEYLLRSTVLKKKYGEIGQGSVSRRKSVPFTSFANLQVRLPPVTEQKRISEILTCVESTILLKQKKLLKIKLTKQSLMQDFLSGHKSVNI